MSSTDLGSIVVHSLRARCIDCLYVRWYRDQLLRYNSSSTYSASILAGTTINNYLWRCSCTAATRSTTILCVFTVQQWPFRPPICPPLRPACLLIAAGIPWPDHFALCCDVYLCLVVLWPQQHWLQYQISSPWGIGTDTELVLLDLDGRKRQFFVKNTHIQHNPCPCPCLGLRRLTSTFIFLIFLADVWLASAFSYDIPVPGTRYKVPGMIFTYVYISYIRSRRPISPGRPGDVSGYPRAWYRSVSWVRIPPSACSYTFVGTFSAHKLTCWKRKNAS